MSIQPMSTKKAPFCYGQFRLHQVDVQKTSVILLRTTPCPSSLCLQKSAILLRTIPSPSSRCLEKKRHFVTDNSVSIQPMSTKTAPFCYGPFRLCRVDVQKKRRFVTDNSVSIQPMYYKKRRRFVTDNSVSIKSSGFQGKPKVEMVEMVEMGKS